MKINYVAYQVWSNHVTEALNASFVSAIIALGGVVAYMYKQIIASKDDHAKCMAAHAKTEERSLRLAEQIKDLREELKSLNHDERKDHLVSGDTAVAAKTKKRE